MDYIAKRYVLFTISGIIILAGIVMLFVNGGFSLDLDFSGGTAIVIDMTSDFDNDEVTEVVKGVIGDEPTPYVQKTGDTQVTIRTRTLESEERDSLVTAIKEKYTLTEENVLSVDNVDPSIGRELQINTIKYILLAAVLMLVYIWFRFELLSGVAAVLTLLHNIIVMVAIYAIFKIPINSTFVAAMLTVFGYSINDTIVIFDRIRENKKLAKKQSFYNTVNKSIGQSLTRTLNTSVTTLVTLVVLYILGVPSIRDFAFPLVIGIAVGTYASIFIASPLWIMFREKKFNISAQ